MITAWLSQSSATATRIRTELRKMYGLSNHPWIPAFSHGVYLVIVTHNRGIVSEVSLMAAHQDRLTAGVTVRRIEDGAVLQGYLNRYDLYDRAYSWLLPDGSFSTEFFVNPMNYETELHGIPVHMQPHQPLPRRQVSQVWTDYTGDV